jgi:hypothetical protein
MKLIAHRGNINGPVVEKENNPDYILDAIKIGYDVEIDVWFLNNRWYLGHDKPDYEIKKDFFLENKDYLWCHAKNIDGLYNMTTMNLNYFWHQNDDYTVTSRKNIWVYPGKQLINNSICVMPENNNLNLEYITNKKCAGICSDFISNYEGV